MKHNANQGRSQGISVMHFRKISNSVFLAQVTQPGDIIWEGARLNLASVLFTLLLYQTSFDITSILIENLVTF